MINRYFILINAMGIILLMLLCFTYRHQQNLLQQQLMTDQQQLHKQHNTLLKQLRQNPSTHPMRTLSLKEWAKQMLKQAEQRNLVVKQISPTNKKLTITLNGSFSSLLKWLFDINRLHFLLHYQQLEMNKTQQQIELRLSMMSKK